MLLVWWHQSTNTFLNCLKFCGHNISWVCFCILYNNQTWCGTLGAMYCWIYRKQRTFVFYLPLPPPQTNSDWASIPSKNSLETVTQPNDPRWYFRLSEFLIRRIWTLDSQVLQWSIARGQCLTWGSDRTQSWVSWYCSWMSALWRIFTS